MTSFPARQDQRKRVRWANDQGSTPSPTSSPDAKSKNIRAPSKPSTHKKFDVEDSFVKPTKAPMPQVGIAIIPIAVMPIPALHPILSYFVFNWDVRATQFPNSLPGAARDEPAFSPIDFPKPITIWFETPLGLSPCTVNPLESNGKPTPINVGRVLACISRELYKPIEPTALHASHPLLPAVRQAAASRPYDPDLNRNKRVPRNIDLYPVSPTQHGAPLFFRYIELQHCGGGAVRLVARFGPKPLKVV